MSGSSIASNNAGRKAAGKVYAGSRGCALPDPSKNMRKSDMNTLRRVRFLPEAFDNMQLWVKFIPAPNSGNTSPTFQAGE
jgi:hypothetical protein